VGDLPKSCKEPFLATPYVYKPNFARLTSFTHLNEDQGHIFKNIHPQTDELASGVEVGLLLHELLAEFLLNRQAFNELVVQERLQATLFEDKAAHVHAMLKKALDVRVGSFLLSSVDSAKIRTEAAFMCKENNTQFIRGSIDVFFEHQGKYYIIDWKSNLLESYSEQALRAEVASQGYDLQAKIYTEACKGFLGNNKGAFGGFYFVFLRGLKEDSAQGVLLYE
jgi:exodeoxyribonuclease V beta subunit